jgi:hypothetical protein
VAGLSRIGEVLDHIERWLGWVQEATDSHNAILRSTALEAIRKRKERLLNDRQTVARLGIPIRRRGDAPSYSVPITRRRPIVVRPPATVSRAYEPEPALSDADYEEAVRIIINSGHQLERSPSTTALIRR